MRELLERFEQWPAWAKWTAAAAGAAVLWSLLTPRRAMASTSRQARDARYGPLRRGVDYAEGKGGRIVISKDWVARNLVRVKLFDGKSVILHKAVAANFAAAYENAVRSSGYHPASVQTWVPRHILWNPNKDLSWHSYGIAVDFDPTRNPWGTGPSVIERFPAFIAAFEAAGWTWGGRWKPGSRDKMHFERAA